MEEDLNLKKQDKTTSLLNSTISSLAAGLSAIASADRKEIILSVGHIIQKMRAGSFLNALKSEWDDYVKQGKISDDFSTSEMNMDCLQELLDFLDKDVPDKTRFEAMKNIYLHLAQNYSGADFDIIPYQLIKVCRGLSSGAILVLIATYQISCEGYDKSTRLNAIKWLDYIAERSKMLRGLVLIYENELIIKGMLTPREHVDASGVTVGEHFRLTELSLAICEKIVL